MTIKEKGGLLMMGQKGWRLPDEYQEVEWVGSNGSSYIDLHHYVNGFENIHIKFQVTDTRKITNGGIYGQITGAWGVAGNTGYGIVAYYYNNQYRLNVYNNGTGNGSIYYSSTLDSLYLGIWDIGISNRQLFINGEYVRNILGDSFVANQYQYLFKINNSKTSVCASRIFIYEDARCHMIPCYNKTNSAIGMYDVKGSICPLTGTPFYINAGTGTFTKGADVL